MSQEMKDDAPLMSSWSKDHVEELDAAYGSVDDSLLPRSRNQGGAINEMPTEGYVLVFEAMRDEFVVEQVVEDNTRKLRVRRNPDYNLEDWGDNGWEDKLEQATDGCKDDLLQHFKEANIKYKIVPSRDKMQKYIYVIVTTPKPIAEEWLVHHNIDVPIDAEQAIRRGRDPNIKNFHLAHRTYLNESEIDELKLKLAKSEKHLSEEDAKQLELIPKELWENIHIPFERFESEEQSKIYKLFDEDTNTVIHPRLYLRVLYEMLTDDISLGGANCIVEKYKADSDHPLVAFFALHQSRNLRPQYNTRKFVLCRGKGQNKQLCEEIRNYYGESVGFYFSFLVHYSFWLTPMAILGALWFIVQLATEAKWGIATPGSTVVVVIAIMWSTLMIENWYRREWKLRFEWGMMRYQQTEVPRPTFEGRIVVSKENGEIIETYANWFVYYSKIIFSMSTMVLCICIVLAVVASLFVLNKGQTDQVITIGIGMANSVQIFIMNKIYTWLAYKLNEWEGHRLQEEWYNNLVIKRIIFIVFNSFYSLFYIAFIDDNEEVYTSNEVRLKAVRTQLVTLFVMAIILQNSMEVFFPWIGEKMKQFCMQRQEDEWQRNHSSNADYVGVADSPLMADDGDVAQGGVYVRGVVDVTDDNVQLSINDGTNGEKAGMRRQNSVAINKFVMEDIEEQVNMSESPDVLDNTAEIVVLQGYIMLFVIVFPVMPALAAINNYFELRIDYYNLVNTQRPVPWTSSGIGVWKPVLSTFNIVAIFSNLGLLVFTTDLITQLFTDVGLEPSDRNLWIFFFLAALILLFVVFVIRMVVDDRPASIKEAIARQEAVEKHLVTATVMNAARKQVDQKKKAKMRQATLRALGNKPVEEELV